MFKNIKLIFLCLLLVFFNTTKNLNSTKVAKESDNSVNFEQELSQLSYDELKERADKSKQISKLLKHKKEIQDLNKIEKVDVKGKLAWLTKANNMLFHNIFTEGVGLGIKELLKTTIVKVGSTTIQYLVILYIISKVTGKSIPSLVGLVSKIVDIFGFQGNINSDNIGAKVVTNSTVDVANDVSIGKIERFLINVGKKL